MLALSRSILSFVFSYREFISEFVSLIRVFVCTYVCFAGYALNDISAVFARNIEGQYRIAGGPITPVRSLFSLSLSLSLSRSVSLSVSLSLCVCVSLSPRISLQ